MAELQFAPWVEPIAAMYHKRRGDLITFARALPSDAWAREAHESGWTCKDLLAHVAGDTGQNLHTALRLVTEGRPLPDSLFVDFDERNARDVQDRRARSVAELVDELRVAGEETQRLLSLLTDADEGRVEPALRGSLRDALLALAEHDATHLDQLRAATRDVGTLPGGRREALEATREGAT